MEATSSSMFRGNPARADVAGISRIRPIGGGAIKIKSAYQMGALQIRDISDGCTLDKGQIRWVHFRLRHIRWVHFR